MVIFDLQLSKKLTHNRWLPVNYFGRLKIINYVHQSILLIPGNCCCNLQRSLWLSVRTFHNEFVKSIDIIDRDAIDEWWDSKTRKTITEETVDLFIDLQMESFLTWIL